VYVGVNTSCPHARSKGRIFFHAHPADQAPCATTIVAIAPPEPKAPAGIIRMKGHFDQGRAPTGCALLS
jgi:hypothetical protein